MPSQISASFCRASSWVARKAAIPATGPPRGGSSSARRTPHGRATSRGATRARGALDPGQRQCDTSDGHEETGDPQQDGQEAVGHRDPCDEERQTDQDQGHAAADMAGRRARGGTRHPPQGRSQLGVILMELRFQVSQDLLLSL